MSDKMDAFNRHRELLATHEKRRHLVPVADSDEVKAQETSGTPAGFERLMALAGPLASDTEEDSTEEGLRMLQDLQRTVRAGRIDQVVAASRRTVVDAVVRPFGLGSFIAAADRRGGAVLTLHNAKVARGEGWSRTDEFADQAKMAEFRGRMESDYERDAYDFDPARRQEVLDATSTDSYTGGPLGDRVDVDHVISARELHGSGDVKNGVPERPDVAFHMSQDAVSDFATSDENLAPTDAGINRSKGAKPLKTWMDEDRGDGTKNAEHYGVDRALATGRDEVARDELARQQRAAAVRHYATGIATAAMKEAGRMGLQQAVGLLMVEMVEAMFDEAAGFLRDRPAMDKTLLARLMKSLTTVANRVLARWKEAVVAFRDGAISGFLSSLVTVLLNMVVTTSKRVVRIIREGVFSVGRAVKLVVAPPENLTPAEAMHEASKLLAAGSMVSVGVAAEEFVEKAILSVPVLTPVAQPLTIIIVGVGAGLATVLLAYLLDEVDAFGVRRDKESHQIQGRLDHRFDAAVAQLKEELSEVELG